jgi:hypothetical protein
VTRAELELVRTHFTELARLLVISGTTFGSAHYQAVQMLRIAVDRINGVPGRRLREPTRETSEAVIYGSTHIGSSLLRRFGNAGVGSIIVMMLAISLIRSDTVSTSPPFRRSVSI